MDVEPLALELGLEVGLGVGFEVGLVVGLEVALGVGFEAVLEAVLETVFGEGTTDSLIIIVSVAFLPSASNARPLKIPPFRSSVLNF